MSRERSPRRWLVVVVLGAVVVGALGFAGGRAVRSPADRIASAEPPEATLLTVSIRSGRLQHDINAEGVAAWPSVVDLPAPTPAGGLSPVITATPVAVGDEVRAGEVLVEVAYRPVIVLPGRIPLLRDLHRGDQGRDVETLQTALAAAGFLDGSTDGTFGPSTVSALRDLYEATGYDPPPGVGASATELVFVDPLPARLLVGVAALGTLASGTLASLAAGEPLVRARVSPSEAAELDRNGAARISLPDTGASVRATIVHRGAETHSEEDGVYVPVLLRPTRPLAARWVGVAAAITFVPPDDAPRGLLVPISAVFTSAAEGTSVRRVDGDEQVLVPVRVIDTADGTMLVKPRREAALDADDEVVIGIDR